MAQKIVVITGCSSGIGLATAALLANNESKLYKVYATMRNLGKKEALEKAVGDNLNKTAFIREMDVSKDNSVKDFFCTLLEEEDKVDVLVNNAGIGQETVIEAVSIDFYHQIMETNYFGMVRTIQAVLPTMKKRRSGRIINVSSDFGIIGCPFLEAYVASKFAVEGFSQSLASVLRSFKIYVSSIQYGPVHTSISENGNTFGAKFEMGEVDNVTQEMFKRYEEALEQIYSDYGQTSEEAAEVMMEIIEADQPKLMYQSHEWATKYISVSIKDTTGENVVEFIRETYKFNKSDVVD
ncbi:retinol dehydrogenase 8-like [Glandiceps talaboti]